ncbi:MAG: GNAT family N-acetyltransferase [Acidimicrobiia bacterium]
MEVTIRPGRAADRATVAEFTRGTFPWGDYVADAFESWLADPSGRILIAADDRDRPVGVARVALLSPTEAWMHAARVRPDCRRMGIGMRLNDEGVAWARERGAVVARLLVEEWNTAPQRQVEKLGYRPVARWVHAARPLDQSAPRTDGNGGQRVLGEERLRLAHASEAEPAWMLWSSGELVIAAHGLYPVGWLWRKMTFSDVVESASHRTLWASPSGWAIASQEPEGIFASWLACTPDDAPRLIRALVDLAQEAGAPAVNAMAPSSDWLIDALTHAGLELHPAVVYQKELR